MDATLDSVAAGIATFVGELELVDEFRVNTYTDNNQSSPSVTGLSDGG